MTRITVTLHEDICTFMISCSLILAINISDKVCNENQNRKLLFNYFLEMSLYEIMRENMALQDKSQIIMLPLAR
jgi:hypothetical protein